MEIPAFPQAQPCLVSEKCPEVWFGWDNLGLHPSGHPQQCGGTTGDRTVGSAGGKNRNLGALRSPNSIHSIIPDVKPPGKPFPAPFLENRGLFHCPKGFLLCLAASPPHIPQVLGLVAVPLLISLDKGKSGKTEEQQHRSSCLL